MKIKSNADLKLYFSQLEPLQLAEKFYGLQEEAAAELRDPPSTEFVVSRLRSSREFCHLALLLIGEEAFGFPEVGQYIGILRRACEEVNVSPTARLEIQSTLRDVLGALVPDIDLRPLSNLYASNVIDTVVARQRLLRIYKIIVQEIKSIRQVDMDKREARLKAFKERFHVPADTLINIRSTPSALARKVISIGMPEHPGEQQLKRILAKASKEQRALLKTGE